VAARGDNDPIRLGLIASLARPGGNLAGSIFSRLSCRHKSRTSSELKGYMAVAAASLDLHVIAIHPVIHQIQNDGRIGKCRGVTELLVLVCGDLA
jgi:hypothetical protein